MVKESLSSDLDLIKEVEQLRLKQKLLIDALKKKTTSKEDEDLNAIHSKLEFLVQIFKEANSTDEDDDSQEEQEKSKEDLILEKLINLESTMVSNFEELGGKISIIENKLKENSNLSNGVEIVENVAPKPNFEVKNDNDKEDDSSSGKKKGWFSK